MRDKLNQYGGEGHGKLFWLLIALFIIMLPVGTLIVAYYSPGQFGCQDLQGNTLQQCWTIYPSQGSYLIGNWTKISNNDQRNVNINYTLSWSCSCNASVTFDKYPVVVDNGVGNWTLGPKLITSWWIGAPNSEVIVYANGYWYSGDINNGIVVKIDGRVVQ